MSRTIQWYKFDFVFFFQMTSVIQSFLSNFNTCGYPSTFEKLKKNAPNNIYKGPFLVILTLFLRTFLKCVA